MLFFTAVDATGCDAMVSSFHGNFQVFIMRKRANTKITFHRNVRNVWRGESDKSRGHQGNIF